MWKLRIRQKCSKKAGAGLRRIHYQTQDESLEKLAEVAAGVNPPLYYRDKSMHIRLWKSR